MVAAARGAADAEASSSIKYEAMFETIDVDPDGKKLTESVDSSADRRVTGTANSL